MCQISHLHFNFALALDKAFRNTTSGYVHVQLFVLPSRYESFGLAAAEALAHGLPVVAFADCPGANEVIRDNENGILVRGARRAEALSCALRTLMAASDLRVALGRVGPASVAMFSKENVCDQWEKLLRAFCSEDDALQRGLG